MNLLSNVNNLSSNFRVNFLGNNYNARQNNKPVFNNSTDTFEISRKAPKSQRPQKDFDKAAVKLMNYLDENSVSDTERQELLGDLCRKFGFEISDHETVTGFVIKDGLVERIQVECSNDYDPSCEPEECLDEEDCLDEGDTCCAEDCDDGSDLECR